jgi:hypothetical protein
MGKLTNGPLLALSESHPAPEALPSARTPNKPKAIGEAKLHMISPAFLRLNSSRPIRRRLQKRAR